MSVYETYVSDANKIEIRLNSDYVVRMREVFEERAERDRISRDNYFFKKGFARGVLKARIKNAISCMKGGIALDAISKAVELSQEELLDLARQNNITLSKFQLGNINE